MRKIRLKATALLLALAVTAGLGGGAMAYTTPDFTDVAPGNWAYEPVMRLADEGIIKGTSATTFSPEMKLSAAMFITLVGRVAYPGEVQTNAEDNWFSAYVRAARAKGLLDGTNVTDEAIEGEITRYEMAVILAHTARTLGAGEQAVDTSKIKDWGDVPQKYGPAVGQAYALGLIQGDNAGNFNGALTMTRTEAATVTARLADLTANLAATPVEPTDQEKPEETTPPVELTGETTTFTIQGGVNCMKSDGSWINIVEGANVVFYFKDGIELGRAVTGADGRFEMELTVDKAYYTYAEHNYYIQGTYIDAAGNKYSNIFENGYIIYENLWDRHGNWSFSLYNHDDYVLDF